MTGLYSRCDISMTEKVSNIFTQEIGRSLQHVEIIHPNYALAYMSLFKLGQHSK